jgi:hypothetical protein
VQNWHTGISTDEINIAATPKTMRNSNYALGLKQKRQRTIHCRSHIDHDRIKSDDLSTRHFSLFPNVQSGSGAYPVSNSMGDRISVGARFFAPVQTGPGAHPLSCTIVIGSFPGGRKRPGRELIPHPLLVPRSKKQSKAIPLLSLRTFVAYKRGEIYLKNCTTSHIYISE